jgi:MoxR-like ATPase
VNGSNTHQVDLDLSFVLRCRDDEERIGHTIQRIAAHLRGLGIRFELLVVDEGSGDNTMAVAALLRATHPDTERVPGIVSSYVRYGASPRGAQAMVLGAKISALLDGRFNVSYADVQAVAAPALRHRVIIYFEGEAEGIRNDSVVRAIIAESPTEPAE